MDHDVAVGKFLGAYPDAVDPNRISKENARDKNGAQKNQKHQFPLHAFLLVHAECI